VPNSGRRHIAAPMASPHHPTCTVTAPPRCCPHLTLASSDGKAKCLLPSSCRPCRSTALSKLWHCHCFPPTVPPPCHQHPPPHVTIKGACRTEVFPFLPPSPLLPPCHHLLLTPPQGPHRCRPPPTIPRPLQLQSKLHAAKEFLSDPTGDHHSSLLTFFPHCQSPPPRTSPPW
jgi:hypothetical protein